MTSNFRPAASRLVFVLLASFASEVSAQQDTEILFFTNSFLPQSVEVKAGEAVTFVWRRGEHTVTSGLPDGEAGSVDEPGALFDVALNEETPLFELEIGVDQKDGVSFFDRENPAQVGFISIDSGEITVRVGVVDNVFVPEVVAIFAGDSIRWEHEPMEAFHTVTSGLSSRPEDDPGALFDEESSDDRPIFVYRFAESADYPYFCRPHEQLDMLGLVRVQRLFLRGDATGDGSVDITDPIRTLNFLFVGTDGGDCDDAMDANDDGQVNIADAAFALGFLFSGGAEISAPFPRPGPDRTDDELLCGLADL